jgi:hypothetical protein
MDRREVLKTAIVGAIAGIASKAALGVQGEASKPKNEGELSEHEKELVALDRAHTRAIEEHRNYHANCCGHTWSDWGWSTNSPCTSRLS